MRVSKQLLFIVATTTVTSMIRGFRQLPVRWIASTTSTSTRRQQAALPSAAAAAFATTSQSLSQSQSQSQSQSLPLSQPHQPQSHPQPQPQSLLKNFISSIIENDLASGKNGGRVVTRFPPEPNGYLHLGHAKSVTFNFAIAKHFGGVTNMRFDDTNPAKEDMEYVLAILDDVRWLVSGSSSSSVADPWNGAIRYASDYFQAIYEAAEYLILNGLAYVDHLSADDMRVYRGTLTEPGKNSPFRIRSSQESLQLFRDMKAGKFEDGCCVLRAKIDMSSPNMNMRDPTLYRIKRDIHPITGDKWCIYPMYDFAHAISDAMEGITHSLCSLEFADHRPLYDWTVDNLLPSGILPFQTEGWRPHQYEFSRLNMQYTVLSKRKLIQLVRDKHVEGWDDPRMPTISGMRRRGYPSDAIKLFCDRVGISKAENNIDMTVLEDCVREVLDFTAPRAMAVLHPLRVVITNWEESHEENFEVDRHPKRPELGKKKMVLTNELFIDRDDFFDLGADGKSAPPKGYKRLVSGGTVRLKFGYVITCDEVIRDENGNVLELRCSYDPSTKSGTNPPGSKKPKGIIQWVSSKHSEKATIRLYDRLFSHPSPGSSHADGNFLLDINSHSYEKIENALVESNLCDSPVGSTFQFERIGYFCVDYDSGEKLIFNRAVTLRDTWSNSITN